MTSLFVRNHASPQVRKMLLEHGGKKIREFIIVREPIAAAIKFLANVLSLGELEKQRKKLGYQDIFHLYSLNLLEDGTVLKIHKEEVIRIIQLTPAQKQQMLKQDRQTSKKLAAEPITLQDAFRRCEVLMGDKMWKYDGIENNCQDFVLGLSRSITTLDQDTIKFIAQDARSLIKDSWILKKILRFVTDLGGIKDRLLEGSSLVIDASVSESTPALPERAGGCHCQPSD